MTRQKTVCVLTQPQAFPEGLSEPELALARELLRSALSRLLGLP